MENDTKPIPADSAAAIEASKKGRDKKSTERLAAVSADLLPSEADWLLVRVMMLYDFDQHPRCKPAVFFGVLPASTDM